jgi:hypothetical protein
MRIDRHNYEEYFVLYIDNELTVEQMKQVEQFATENPDLGEELVMLQQSRLIPDESIVFDDKHLLMKEENDSFINMTNYEEWLVSYIDNEVNQEQRIVIEKFAASHPHVQQEFALFQQAKLQPEKIFFANKEVLYKRQRARIVSMQWWRISAAAILVLAVGIGLFSTLNKKASTSGTIARTETKKTTKQQPPSTPNATSSNKNTSTPVGAVQPITENQSLATTTNHKVEKTHARKPKMIGDEKTNEQQVAVSSTRAHVDTREKIAVQSIEPKSPEMATLNENALNEKRNTRKIVAPSVTNPTVETPHVMYASNTDNDENKRFRGFFRKASRIIERSTNVNPNANDDRVLIGGMAINLK